MIERQTVKSPSYKKLLAAFQKEKIARRRGKLSSEDIAIVTEFLWFLESKDIFDIKKVTYGFVHNAYLKDYLSIRPNKRKSDSFLSGKSIIKHAQALSKLNQYLLQTNRIKQGWGTLKSKPGDSVERTVISQEEVPMLFGACENSFERALLAISYGCGLRRTEMKMLNSQDINLREGILIVREGKGSKRRVVALSEKIVEYLQEYMRGERLNRLEHVTVLEHAFFITKNGERTKWNYLNDVFRAIIKRTDNEDLMKRKLSLHSMRHSIAEHLLKNGADFEFVQLFLGHSCIDSTMIYAKKLKLKQQNKKLTR
jgi:integrase/recombinase XerD